MSERTSSLRLGNLSEMSRDSAWGLHYPYSMMQKNRLHLSYGRPFAGMASASYET